MSLIQYEEDWEYLPVYFFVSVMVHILIFFLLPYPLETTTERKIEVKLVEKTSLRIAPEKEIEKASKERISHLLKYLEKEITNREKGLSSPSKIPPPIPLPVVEPPIKGGETIEELARREIRSLRTSSPVELVNPELVSIDPDKIPIFVPKEVLKIKETQERRETVKSGFLEFKGPITERKIVYMPPKPKVEVRENTVVYLRFWVEPDGSVVSVKLLKINGDPLLGATAIQFIKCIRFNPSINSNRVWGEVKVIFKRL